MKYDPRTDPRMAEEVALARERWAGRSRSKRVTVSFDEMVDFFSDDCIRFSDIGVTLGVSRERVRQLWRDIFSPMFVRRSTGRSRMKVCTLSKRSEFINHSPVPQELADVVSRLNSAIASPAIRVVARFYATDNKHVSTRDFRVNSAIVRVYRVGSCSASGSRYYKVVGRLPKGCDFAAVVCGHGAEQTYFLFPRNVFHEWGGRTTRYIPVRRAIRDLPNVNTWVWNYQDAWHLLAT